MEITSCLNSSSDIACLFTIHVPTTWLISESDECSVAKVRKRKRFNHELPDRSEIYRKFEHITLRERAFIWHGYRLIVQWMPKYECPNEKNPQNYEQNQMPGCDCSIRGSIRLHLLINHSFPFYLAPIYTSIASGWRGFLLPMFMAATCRQCSTRQRLYWLLSFMLYLLAGVRLSPGGRNGLWHASRTLRWWGIRK